MHSTRARLLAAIFVGLWISGGGLPVYSQQHAGKNRLEVAPAKYAAQMAQGCQTLLYAAAMTNVGLDEASIYRSIKTSLYGEQVVLDLEMPRETFCALLSRQLSAS